MNVINFLFLYSPNQVLASMLVQLGISTNLDSLAFKGSNLMLCLVLFPVIPNSMLQSVLSRVKRWILSFFFFFLLLEQLSLLLLSECFSVNSFVFLL